MIKYNTRFAPSPNGYLHLGHAFSAIVGQNLASKNNGKFFLRIEDIDIGRCKKGFEDSIYDDLAWLKIKYEKENYNHNPFFQYLLLSLIILKLFQFPFLQLQYVKVSLIYHHQSMD